MAEQTTHEKVTAVLGLTKAWPADVELARVRYVATAAVAAARATEDVLKAAAQEMQAPRWWSFSGIAFHQHLLMPELVAMKVVHDGLAEPADVMAAVLAAPDAELREHLVRLRELLEALEAAWSHLDRWNDSLVNTLLRITQSADKVISRLLGIAETVLQAIPPALGFVAWLLEHWQLLALAGGVLWLRSK